MATLASQNTLTVIEESKSQCYARMSTPIFLGSKHYTSGHTPQWDTFESMEIDFEIDSDDDDLSEPEPDEYEESYLKDIEYDENSNNNNNKQKIRASVPPSIKMQHHKKNEKKIKTIALKNRASVPPNMTKTNKASKHMKSASMPMKQIKHFTINRLTIWSNHKQELTDLHRRKSTNKKNIFLTNEREKKKSLKNIKFTADKSSSDDMKSQFESYAKDEKMAARKYLICEIIDTEESYVKGLHTLYFEFIVPMIARKLIKIADKDKITVNILDLYLFHKQFLGCLKNRNERSIASIFYEICNVDFIAMYTKYTCAYQQMLDVYARYDDCAKYKMFLKEKRAEKKPLTNHLILPIQRVTRYLLLLEELKECTPQTHTNYKELEAVIIKILESVNVINEKQREIENMSQCLQVQETLHGLKENIVKSERKLCAQLIFRKKSNQRQRQFFLFNDLLIISNLKLRVKAVINLRTIEIKRLNENENESEFHLYSLHHQAIYEADIEMSENVHTLKRLIEEYRSAIHQNELINVGATSLATKLSDGTQRVSQGTGFRKQLNANANAENVQIDLVPRPSDSFVSLD